MKKKKATKATVKRKPSPAVERDALERAHMNALRIEGALYVPLLEIQLLFQRLGEHGEHGLFVCNHLAAQIEAGQTVATGTLSVDVSPKKKRK
jgi:hypothetical protein